MNHPITHSSPASANVLVLASRNVKKAREMEAQLLPHGLQVKSLAEFPEVGEIHEDGDSFAENAAKKACETARQIGQWTIGEDSGLCVDALGGAPGIFSARFSGPEATDEANNALLIERLRNVNDARRTACYVSHVALADPRGELRLSVERTCRGVITREPRGTNGFGYDPYFLIREYGRTFGELPSVVKKCISHRARAFQAFLPQLISLLRDS